MSGSRGYSFRRFRFSSRLATTINKFIALEESNCETQAAFIVYYHNSDTCTEKATKGEILGSTAELPTRTKDSSLSRPSFTQYHVIYVMILPSVVINFFRPWNCFHLPWLYRLYYPLCVSRRIDTWQIVYLSNKDPCPKISINKSEINAMYHPSFIIYYSSSHYLFTYYFLINPFFFNLGWLMLTSFSS